MAYLFRQIRTCLNIGIEMKQKMNSLVYLFLYFADSGTSDKYNFFPNLPVVNHIFHV